MPRSRAFNGKPIVGFIMISSQAGCLGPLALVVLFVSTEAISKNFVNSSMPKMRPTFVVNFDMATVICQHSDDPKDLHLHEISVLCDGKRDCYQNPAMHDESFPYCERKCNSTCNDRGACLYDGEKPQCYCNSGFSGPMCEIIDKNECLDKPCHWLAHCQNTLGSYECKCFQGFHGDGYRCADIDECSVGEAHCPEHSHCVNLPGTFFCNCTEGFAPKGLPLEKCADINECELNLHNCKNNQICQNTIGEFKCVDRCSTGYEFVNGECVDIDECRLENTCDKRAECTNTPGGYKCTCDPGLTGDGKNCSPITDCSQQENICDRHAFCINSLKLCICQAGYAGDGITCNDVNECEAVENPCVNQEGSRCMNIQGGYICCKDGIDDETCIQDQGAYCAGGCGLHAVCFNQTCQCMEGFVGDPYTKCIDVNECESDQMCAGVGQWCVNKLGGHICCAPDSKDVECQDVHVFKTKDGEVLLQYNSSKSEVIVEGGSVSHSSAGGIVLSRKGSIKESGTFPNVNISTTNELVCTSYCPANSECIDGVCKCMKGFGGNAVFGCEDIDECSSLSPCANTKDSWCVNTIGSFYCCDPTSNQTLCIGLEIVAGPGGGFRLTGTSGEAFVAASINETIGGETITERIHQVSNFSAGEIIVVKNKVKSGDIIYEAKPEKGELGLEISGDKEDEVTTTPSDITVTLPGIVSTLDGISTFTTSIPITAIPIHEITTQISNSSVGTTDYHVTVEIETGNVDHRDLPDSSGHKVAIDDPVMSITTETTLLQRLTTEEYNITQETTVSRIISAETDVTTQSTTLNESTATVDLEKITTLAINKTMEVSSPKPNREPPVIVKGSGEEHGTVKLPEEKDLLIKSAQEETKRPTIIDLDKTSSRPLKDDEVQKSISTEKPSTITDLVITIVSEKTEKVAEEKNTKKGGHKSENIGDEYKMTTSEPTHINTTILATGENILRTTTSKPESTVKSAKKMATIASEKNTPLRKGQTKENNTSEKTNLEIARTTKETILSTKHIDSATKPVILETSTSDVTSYASITEATTEAIKTSSEGQIRIRITTVGEESNAASTKIASDTNNLPKITYLSSQATTNLQPTTISVNDMRSQITFLPTKLSKKPESSRSSFTSTESSAHLVIEADGSGEENVSEQQTGEIKKPENTVTIFNRNYENVTTTNTIESEPGTTFTKSMDVELNGIRVTNSTDTPSTIKEFGLEITNEIDPDKFGLEIVPEKKAATEDSNLIISSTEKSSTLKEPETNGTSFTIKTQTNQKSEFTGTTVKQSSPSGTEILENTKYNRASVTEDPKAGTNVTEKTLTPKRLESPNNPSETKSSEILVNSTSETNASIGSTKTIRAENSTFPSQVEREDGSGDSTNGLQRTVTAHGNKYINRKNELLETDIHEEPESSTLKGDEEKDRKVTPYGEEKKNKVITSDTEETSKTDEMISILNVTTISALVTKQEKTENNRAISVVSTISTESTPKSMTSGSSISATLQLTTTTYGTNQETGTTFSPKQEINTSESTSFVEIPLVSTQFPEAPVNKLVKVTNNPVADSTSSLEINSTEVTPTKVPDVTISTNKSAASKENTGISVNSQSSTINPISVANPVDWKNPNVTAKQSRQPIISEELVTSRPFDFSTQASSSMKPLLTKDTFSLATLSTLEPPDAKQSSTMRCISGDQCGDDSYCERRTGACRCYPGFEGSPPNNICRDVDECARGLHNCDDSARCYNYVGGYSCFCPMGYRKTDNGTCQDIDECMESHGGCCSGNATCINKAGSYGCECNEGFTGDGYSCVPVEKRTCSETELNAAKCGQNHVCMVDGKGTKDCDTCKMGFEMNNGICKDVNECAVHGLNMCDKNAVCKNLIGTYSCECKSGYRGDGYMCEDEDECRRQPCHPQAECTNTAGSFECQCPEGFTGDGLHECTNPLEVSCRDVAGFCGRSNYTACLSVRVFDGSLTSICECEPNYRYNEVTKQCEDIDECAENRHNCDPASAVCINEDGGFRCECLEGYEGTGGVCVDVDECERGLAGCHVRAMCINQPGSCGCKCMEGFGGDGTQCSPMSRESDNACTLEWQRLCSLENKTCHVDEEEVPQCGSCLEGHHPINGSCQPIQNRGNCADPAKNNCDKNAECIDVLPSRHFCSCKIGYIGDGMRCDDIDECSVSGICDANAVCINLPGSFECSCNSGFSGNGFICSQNETNKTKSHDCRANVKLCHSNATCMNDGKCRCNDGFKGDGINFCSWSGISTSMNVISTTLLPSELSKGTIMKTDEKDSVEIISGDSRQNRVYTTDTTTSGKELAEQAITSPFERQSLPVAPVTTTINAIQSSLLTTANELPNTIARIETNVTATSLLEISGLKNTTESPLTTFTSIITIENESRVPSSTEQSVPLTPSLLNTNKPTSLETSIHSTMKSGVSITSTSVTVTSPIPITNIFSTMKDSTILFNQSGATTDNSRTREPNITILTSTTNGALSNTADLTNLGSAVTNAGSFSEVIQESVTSTTSKASITSPISIPVITTAFKNHSSESKSVTESSNNTIAHTTDVSLVTISSTKEAELAEEATTSSSTEVPPTTLPSSIASSITTSPTLKYTNDGNDIEDVTEKLGSTTPTTHTEQNHNNSLTSHLPVLVNGDFSTKSPYLETSATELLISTISSTDLTIGPPSMAPPNVVASMGPAISSMVYSTSDSDEPLMSASTKTTTVTGPISSNTAQNVTSLSDSLKRTTNPIVNDSINPSERSLTTEDDLAVNIHSETTTLSSRELTKARCSFSDRSMCHDLAICEIATGACRCKDGFEGDGYRNCTKITALDCVSEPGICHSLAICDRHTRRCQCPIGHIGDGFICSPDPQDCIIRKNLCSPEAICSGRRCQCVEGFTGDGIRCVSLHQRSANCSECDPNAHCEHGMCKCNVGYFGNGLCCVPDPLDCVIQPGVCHPEATCYKDKRECKCNQGYLGNGISCFPIRSCRSDPSVCHHNAICVPSGVCICKHGFEGNGHSCRKVTPTALRHPISDIPTSCGDRCDSETQLCIDEECKCKHGYENGTDGKCYDIDECSFSPCHHLATCLNLRGSFICTCPDGYTGDGKTCIQHLKIGELGVYCEPDGITLVLGNETESFEGRIYVRGQAESPHCSKTFSTLQQHSRPYTFKVPFAHCNVRLEDHNTFATTVIVQKHPMFITTSADAYDLRCTYPVGVKEVVSHVNVSELATSSTLTDKMHGPFCKLTVTNEDEETIESAVVGQSLKLRLEVTPNETYSILPKNCLAINIETDERYLLTDDVGCAIDATLFPDWTRIRPSMTEALFRSFKWPDTSMIRFQCDCSACVKDCPLVKCGMRRAAADKLFRFRRARHTSNDTDSNADGFDYIDTEAEELSKKLIDPKRLAFSSLIKIREDEEETRAQQQIDQWKNGIIQENDVFTEETQDKAFCIRTIFILSTVVLVCTSIVILLVTSFQRRRKSEDVMPNLQNNAISITPLQC